MSAKSATARGFYAYDHSDFCDWPEYQALGRALDDFAHRLDREQRLSQVEFEQMVVAVARHLVASDCCPYCMRAGQDVRAWAPYANTAEGRLEGSYMCDRDHGWPCTWGSREEVSSLP